MNANKFLATGVSIVLPTKRSPRVYLAIDNSSIAKQSYKLYNPFSLKAKFLKQATKFISVYFNAIAKVVLPTITHDKSKFIEDLETKIGQSIQSSVYISTAKDKIVLQLQNNGNIIGYLKYAISPIGEKRILNEKKAIELLSNLKLAPKILDSGYYEQTPYILLENIEGKIGWVADKEYLNVLSSLQKENKFKLKEHPRTHDLIQKLEEYQLHDEIQKLNQELEASTECYAEVFEHGDFAPWNLIRLEDKVVAFDFEYFEEQGLQYLDEIKYHFQLNHLMNKKTGKDLIHAIADKMKIKEFNLIFLLFLAKEIVNKCEAKESYDLERSLWFHLP